MPSARPDAGGASHCLNCAAELHGPFCGECGQRTVPAHPTVRELAGDAWHELTGYDGRVAATFRALLHPGRLTREYLDGHRARYLSPVRLYLIVSVVYFVVAAAAPAGGPGIRVGVTGGDAEELNRPEMREKLRADAESASWVSRPLLLVLAAEGPDGLRARMFTTMPRVFFAMLPVFAAIAALFYRGRTFPTHLVFAVHLHAFVFVGATLSELAKFTGWTLAAQVVAVNVTLALTVYILFAFRTVYGDGWVWTIAKAAGIGAIYLLASIPAFIVILLWAVMR